MITRWIDWCAQNRFLVFMGTLLLVLAGIWSLRRIPLDALPDISDVEVIIHTPWAGEPPSIIEDQVTYPIVTTVLAAPHVKAVRAQTMFGDSYVFVVFEDGTDLYWARSRVLEYVQQIQGRLGAAAVNFRSVCQRNGARFVVLTERGVGPSVAVNEGLEGAALRAALAHEDLVVAQNDLRVDDLATVGADAASEFVEDVVGVLFRVGLRTLRQLLSDLRWVSHWNRAP